MNKMDRAMAEAIERLHEPQPQPTDEEMADARARFHRAIPGLDLDSVVAKMRIKRRAEIMMMARLHPEVGALLGKANLDRPRWFGMIPVHVVGNPHRDHVLMDAGLFLEWADGEGSEIVLNDDGLPTYVGAQRDWHDFYDEPEGLAKLLDADSITRELFPTDEEMADATRRYRAYDDKGEYVLAIGYDYAAQAIMNHARISAMLRLYPEIAKKLAELDPDEDMSGQLPVNAPFPEDDEDDEAIHIMAGEFLGLAKAGLLRFNTWGGVPDYIGDANEF
jgi:hypothetical protein